MFLFNFLFFQIGQALAMHILMVTFNLILAFVYYVIYQHKSGQTFGKQFMGIKVITIDGQTPTIRTFFLREYVGKLLSTITLGIGYFMVVFDTKKQALHDKLAGTFVIKV